MKKNHTIIEVSAEVMDKKPMDYFPIPGKMPTPTEIYEIQFKLEDNIEKSFEVSVFEYNVLDIGDKGLLRYQGTKLLSFSDKIKEFKDE